MEHVSCNFTKINFERIAIMGSLYNLAYYSKPYVYWSGCSCILKRLEVLLDAVLYIDNVHTLYENAFLYSYKS